MNPLHATVRVETKRIATPANAWNSTDARKHYRRGHDIFHHGDLQCDLEFPMERNSAGW